MRIVPRMRNWWRREIVQAVPDDVALCEFDCRRGHCAAGDWATCDRRLTYLSPKPAEDAAALTPRLMPGRGRGLAEQFVTWALTETTGGRLSPFVPVSGDAGVDLIVHDAEIGHSVAVRLESWIGELPTDVGTIEFEIPKLAWNDHPRTALLAMVLRPKPLSMAAAWLIPMPEVAALGTERPECRTLSPSLTTDPDDAYHRFRHADVPSLTAALSGMLCA